MSYMYGICCVPFLFSKNRLSKILFSNPFPKKRSDVNLDLIRRIHSECGFYGFMIRFWICPQKRQIRFWIRKSRFGFSPKKTHPPTLLREENDSKQLDEIQAKSHLRFSESLKLGSKIGYVCRMKDEFPVGTFQDYLFRSSIWFRNFLERLLYRLYTQE